MWFSRNHSTNSDKESKKNGVIKTVDPTNENYDSSNSTQNQLEDHENGLYVMTESEKAGVNRMLKSLSESGLAEDHLTGRYMLRWLREFRGNVEAAENGIKEYAQSRTAGGFDMDNYLELWEHQRLIKEYLPYFSMSKFKRRVVNPKDNSLVVFGRAAGVDYRKLVHVMRSSDVILTYFAYGEYIFRQVLQQERESNRNSGVICIYDLSGLHMSEFVTSGSALLHVSRMCINVMQKWYNTEGLRAIYFVYPPRVMLFSFQFAKMIMNEGTRRKIQLITKPEKQLPALGLHPDCIPVQYGGNLLDDSGWSEPPELCVSRPKIISTENYSFPGEVWNKYGNGKGESKLVYPRLTLTTTKLPEEGVIVCERDWTYRVSWTNMSSYLFNIKVEYSISLHQSTSPPTTPK